VNPYKDELSKIRGILRDNPRGLTISEISNELSINRNSVAKYADVLLTLGHIEMKRIGPAKLYYLSDRIPISAMLNFSRDSIIVFNKERKIVQINDSALKLMGANREDVIGQDFSITNFMQEPHSMMKRYMEECINGKGTSFDYAFEYANIENHFHMKFVPTIFDTGDSGLTLIMDNITEQKIAEKKIQESNERFHTLFNALKIGVLMIGNDGAFYKINPEAERIFDLKYDVYKNELIRGMSFERITLDGEPMPPEEMAGPQARDGKKRIDGIFMGLRWQDGSFSWLKVSAEPVLNEDGEVDKIMAFYEDITEKVGCSRIISKLKSGD